MRRLVADQWTVVTYDSAKGENICDTLRLQESLEAANPDIVFHLAAYANVRRAPEEAARVFEVNTRGTYNVLEAMRHTDCRRILFTSSCSVYGEPSEFPTTEQAPFPIQTSLYGASKVAGEALVQAYDATYQFTGIILRLATSIGEGLTRGHLVDLHRQLKQHPDTLRVMGNGNQKKSYLYVADCVDAMLLTMQWPKPAIFNVAGECWTVKDSVRELQRILGTHAYVEYQGETRGWVGDSPHIEPSTEKLRIHGWSPSLTTQDAVVLTIEWLERQS